MLRVRVGETEYAVKWMHNQVGTLCILRAGSPGEKWRTMESVDWRTTTLHWRDQYNKDIGRRLSLSRILQVQFPYESEYGQKQNYKIRKQFWAAYQKMIGKKGARWNIKSANGAAESSAANTPVNVMDATTLTS